MVKTAHLTAENEKRRLPYVCKSPLEFKTGLLSDQLVRVDNIFIGKDFNEIDQGKDIADAYAKAHNDFENALFGFAHHKVVNPDAAQEKANQSHSDFILTVEIVTVYCFFQGYTAVDANFGVFSNLSAAIGTESAAFTDFDSAAQADCLIIVHLDATVSTIH